ncbi:MAG: VanW family protein [Ardenticatenaceae bacterium]|nr:VanW family protein [Ardenticatenaceae bacterium]MCB8990610.1 VanW family protein [Ardenticatenaceae bacterium]MCB9004317.1 VanW family protein [Ardenticatenaceae bacterium]
MQAVFSVDRKQLSRNLSFFLIVPLTTLVMITIVLALIVSSYQSAHDGRIYTGVSVWGIDLSEKTPAEAEAALASAFPYPLEEAITFIDPATGQEWVESPVQLGLTFDTADTVQMALDVGRSGGVGQQIRDLFGSWYYGRSLSPVIVFDEGRLDAALAELATAVEQPARSASFDLSGSTAEYAPGQLGRRLDLAYVREQLLAPITDFRQAQVELLIHDVEPALMDDTAVAAQIQQMTSNPLHFYLEEPLAEDDLHYVELPVATLVSWLRVEMTPQSDGTMQHTVLVDENAARAWLSQYAEQLYREPVRARFYFDDDTRELVLVAPHVNGRELDVDATLEQLKSHLGSADRYVPLVVDDIIPEVQASSTAADLGITELITQSTTWFYGSSDERKHNIARAAANFFGIVVAPYEEFSFNKYLGSISEDDGYTEGLIIVGGQTIKGIGGGVCQVSTTLYQTAFLGGFPIVERWEHGYWLDYYNDGQGPGMDATVYSPIVDMRFINNTPYYLLIENYYDTENEALTFKFYSTGMGRQVVKTEPEFFNMTERPSQEEDRWVYDPDLEPGTVLQIDWATPGVDVVVQRTVYNADGEPLIDESVSSHYIPYPNTYHYGPGVEPYDYSLVPDN